MEEVIRNGPLEEKRRRLELMMPYLRGGAVCEMGCGSGFVLEFLASNLPGGVVVGMDRSIDRLGAAASKGLPGVLVLAGDLRARALRSGIFDGVIFVWSLHEVFSGAGDDGVRSALKTAADLLTSGGVIVIQDFLKPSAEQVVMGFKNDEARARFERFAREFRQREIVFEDLDGLVRLDVADAVEFISKYHHADEDDEWRDEMEETHFFYSLDDHRLKAAEMGLDIVTAERRPLRRETLEMAATNVDLDLRPYFCWTHIVLRKT